MPIRAATPVILAFIRDPYCLKIIHACRPGILLQSGKRTLTLHGPLCASGVCFGHRVPGARGWHLCKTIESVRAEPLSRREGIGKTSSLTARSAGGLQVLAWCEGAQTIRERRVSVTRKHPPSMETLHSLRRLLPAVFVVFHRHVLAPVDLVQLARILLGRIEPVREPLVEPLVGGTR